MKTLINRIYSDYVMPSRLDTYEKFVRLAQDAGYTQTSVRLFSNSLHHSSGPDKKLILHRHDIDTDLRTTRKIFEIEKKYNIKSSYYFRISTLDFNLMHEIEEYGSEASYHYEELATFIKKNKIRNSADARVRLPEIRQEFLANFRWIEQRFGKKMTTVASHGDFSNRRLKLTNTEILDDGPLRKICGIECETYDRILLENIDIYIADRPHPQYYHPISPFDAIGKHERIYLLTHPRQVETNWTESTKDNLLRCYEGLRW